MATCHRICGFAGKIKKIKKSVKKGWTKRYLFVPFNGAETLLCKPYSRAPSHRGRAVPSLPQRRKPAPPGICHRDAVANIYCLRRRCSLCSHWVPAFAGMTDIWNSPSPVPFGTTPSRRWGKLKNGGRCHRFTNHYH